MPVRSPSGESLDRALTESGVAPLNRDSLTVALSDPRPEVRSLAALKLKRIGTFADVEHIVSAWAAESDLCTKVTMTSVLSLLVPGMAFDRTQHPGGQPWIAPFQACTASEPAVVKLTVEQVTGPEAQGPTVRISARNQTPRTLAFMMGQPEQLFSVTVLGPTGAPAKIAQVREPMFEPASRGKISPDAGIGHSPTFLPLAPQEDATVWTWRVGEDFDMSAPGTYHVSVGGRIAYLDTTVCSNTATVTVEK